MGTSPQIENIKNNQLEFKKTVIEVKNMLEGINIRIAEAEEWNSDLQDRTIKSIQAKQQKLKKKGKNVYSLRDLLNIFK